MRRSGPSWVTLALLLTLAGGANGAPRRHALIVGQNFGLGSEPPLRHAEEDARRVAAVLEELGGFEHVTLLESPTAAELTLAVSKLPPQLDLLLFYYSGHAGEGALHLEGDVVPGRALVQSLDEAGAKLRVAVVDACESGDIGATRTKGLSVRPARLESLSALPTEGRVLLASSSPGEAAQESDRLGGSFFTAHLVAGLRGAADVDANGRVTLREVYQHARERTMDDTFLSAAGMQRPSFRMRLDGEDDVVLTWTAEGGAQLELGGDMGGRYIVTTTDRGHLMAEVALGPNERRVVTFPEGSYQIKKREPERALIAEIRLAAGRPVSLRDADMERVPLVRVSEKGSLRGAYAVGLRLGTGLGGAEASTGMDLGYAFDFGPLSLWPSLRITAGWARGGDFDRDVIAADLGVALTYSLLAPRWRAWLGLRPAVMIVHQRLGALGNPTGTLGQAEALLGADVWVADQVGLFGLLGAGAAFGREVEDPRVDRASWSARPSLSLELGVRWR